MLQILKDAIYNQEATRATIVYRKLTATDVNNVNVGEACR